MYTRFLKRFIDIILSFTILVFLSPIFLIISFFNLIFNGLPIFYLADRCGKNGKTFKIIKFRTMIRNAESVGGGTTANNDSRITKFGKILRKTKLDELPQFINVFIGQMSLIGPRPELTEYTSSYSSEEKKILTVKPGITDYSSIEYINLDKIVGSSDNSEENYKKIVLPYKNLLRLKYVNNLSFKTDFIIFIRTAIAVFKKAISTLLKIDIQVERIKLKGSKLRVSRVCFGGCPMGGYGWGKSNENDFINAVHTAIELGINYFDTADVYGLGESERVLGKALKGIRRKAIIQTKFGVRRIDGKTYYDNSPEWIEESANNSLKRLDTNYIDIFVIHYLDEKTELSSMIPVFKKLRKEKKVRYFGLSNLKEKDIATFKKYRRMFVNFQNEFSLAQRKNEKLIFTLQKELKLTPLTWGSLGQGVLSGRINKNTVFGDDDRRSRPEYVNFHGAKFDHNLFIVEELKKLSIKYGRPIPSIAERYILDKIKKSVLIVGVKNREQIIDSFRCLNWRLDKKDIKYLDDISYWGPDYEL